MRSWPTVTRPPPGVGIRLGHPLARGLVGAFLPGTAGNLVSSLLVDGGDTATFVGTTSIVAGPAGMAMRTNTTATHGGCDEATPSSLLKPTTAVTVMWRGVLYASVSGDMSNSPNLVACTYDNAGSSPFVAYGLARDSTTDNNIQFVFNAGGTFASTPGVTSFLLGVPYTVFGTFDGTFGIVWLNGAQVTSVNQGGAMTYGTGPVFAIGIHPFAATDCSHSDTTHAYVWNRVLTVAEMMVLTVNPNALLVQPPSRLFAVPGFSSTTAALTIGSEMTLVSASPSVPTYYWAEIDCSALASGEVLFVNVYTKVLAGGTERLTYTSTFIGGTDLDLVQYTVPVPTDVSYRIGITQQNGTGRTFPWKVIHSP